MLAHYSQHNPDGIRELCISTVEKIMNEVGEAPWEFIQSDSDVDIPKVLSTIGNVRNGQPDIVLGFVPVEQSFHNVRQLVVLVLEYLEYIDRPIEGDIDREDVYTFVRDRYDDETADNCFFTHRMVLRKIDAPRWFAGLGWHHAQFYNADERKDACIYQLILSDDQNRIPGEEGYDGFAQYLVDTKPFGIGVEPNARREARGKYLN